MPGFVYTGKVADLPREVRFNETYERTGLVMDNANMCFVWSKPKPGGPIENVVRGHRHPFDMMVFVIDGNLKMRVGDADYELNAGEFVYVPRDVFHGALPTHDKPAFVLEIFAPIRTDYLYVADHQLNHGQARPDADGRRHDRRPTQEAATAMLDSAVELQPFEPSGR